MKTKVRSRLHEKTPIPRSIKLSTEFSKYLQKYLNTQTLKDTDRIGILNQSSFWTAMRKALKKALIKDYYMFSVHNIRKTAENWIWSLGVPETVFVKTFGHDIDTATKHYLQNDTWRFSEKDEMKEIIGDWAERLKGEKD